MLLTPRNIFIANLALSNLLLCVFTMPLTLADLLTKYWPLGEDMVRFAFSYVMAFHPLFSGCCVQVDGFSTIILCVLLIFLNTVDSH